MEQKGLFTEEFWLRRLCELGDNLEKLDCIDWELFRPEIEKALAARKGELLNEKDRALYADSAYTGPTVLDKLPENVNEIHICEKGVRNRPLTDEQKRRNSAIEKVRCRIEHVFGFMTRSMHELKIRGIGMVRARFDICLINLVYNMFRYPSVSI